MKPKSLKKACKKTFKIYGNEILSKLKEIKQRKKKLAIILPVAVANMECEPHARDLYVLLSHCCFLCGFADEQQQQQQEPRRERKSRWGDVAQPESSKKKTRWEQVDPNSLALITTDKIETVRSMSPFIFWGERTLTISFSLFFCRLQSKLAFTTYNGFSLPLILKILWSLGESDRRHRRRLTTPRDDVSTPVTSDSKPDIRPRDKIWWRNC